MFSIIKSSIYGETELVLKEKDENVDMYAPVRVDTEKIVVFSNPDKTKVDGEWKPFQGWSFLSTTCLRSMADYTLFYEYKDKVYCFIVELKAGTQYTAKARSQIISTIPYVKFMLEKFHHKETGFSCSKNTVLIFRVLLIGPPKSNKNTPPRVDDGMIILRQRKKGSPFLPLNQIINKYKSHAIKYELQINYSHKG